MNKHECLSVEEIKQLPIGDFLKQDYTSLTDTENSHPNEAPLIDEASKTKQHEYDEYICQNEKCPYLTKRDEITDLHVFEIDGDHNIVICDKCYEAGFRFCLFTHDVMPLDQLDPVLDNMYAQPAYHQGQLNKSILDTLDDIYTYFQLIGIENPNPTHVIINLRKIN